VIAASTSSGGTAPSRREVTVLGTAAQSPTASRNQNGYVLRWDAETILFDPGEGTQRQMLLARVSAASITRICITHFHGDHCLGLPGVVQRRSMDRNPRPIDVHYPAAGHAYLERLLRATIWDEDSLEVRLHATDDGDSFALGEHSRLVARALDHTVPTLGWCVDEGPRRHFDPLRLANLHIEGPAVGRLQRQGWIEHGDTRVAIDDVSTMVEGQRFAFVMDTRPCVAACELAQRADLLLIESTYLRPEAALAAPRGHLTVDDAARIANEAGARRVVLSHFSDRYVDLAPFGEEAGRLLDDYVVATDLAVVPVPSP